MSRNRRTSTPFRRDETVFGWGWWAIQLVLLPSILHAVNGVLPHPFSDAELNFTFYLLNFLIVVVIFHHFLADSFRNLLAHPILCCEAVILGLFFWWAGGKLMDFCIHLLDPRFVNRNDSAISAMFGSSFYLMSVGTVVLVPPVEECFYRGLMYRGLAVRSEAAALAVSTAVFSLIHILGYVGKTTPLTLLLSFLQYIPAGLTLAWSYHRSGTIFAPMFIHAIINAYSISTLR